ncbi:MAG: ABC transporter substrate-binding protein [Chloroflexi bacterium]|nr:ABC transporter substrate-binding protein [Chloroflexota bacterium]
MAEHENYWSRRRLTRRAVVKGALAAGAGLGTLAIAGCGDDDDAPADGPSGGASPTATAVKPQQGGVYRGMLALDPLSLDPYLQVAGAASAFAALTYSRLLDFKPGVGKPSSGEVTGELAESWELPGDGRQITLKLRPNAKWDPRAPTNGRAVDADDVKFSWEKFAAKSPFRTDLANSASKSAPIESIQVIDPQTVVFKTAFPSALLLSALASDRHLFIQPKEAASGLDLAKDPRGSGPFMVEEYTPSVRAIMAKNPGYWAAPERPLVDKLELPIITEAAQRHAQFRAKKVWNGAVDPTDIPTFQSELKGTKVIPVTADARNPNVGFGWKPGSPFLDERVRQAVSMLVDRASFIEVFLETERLKKAGVDVQPAPWGTILSGLYGDFWLDPLGKDFGENAKFYQFNIAEAKKLLDSAGYGNGFETPGTYITTAEFEADFPRRAEVIIEMLAKGGIRVKPHVVEYQAFISGYARGKGNYDGISFNPHGGRYDPGAYLSGFIHSTGPTSSTAGNTMPELDALIELANRQLDRKERLATFHEIQRLCAKTQPMVPMGAHQHNIDLTWEWVHGLGDVVGWAGVQYGRHTQTLAHHYWIDNARLS